MRNFRISEDGLSLIKHFEGFYPTAYFCPAGVPTIGYGHTSTVTYEDVETKYTITEEEAVRLLDMDLDTAEEAVNRLVTTHMHQAHFDALCSFTFNVGVGAFGRSTLLRHLNKGKFAKAAKEFLKWVNAGGVKLEGLVRRRKAERYLFETGKLKFHF